MLAVARAGWPTVLITAPVTRRPPRVVSGTAPGAAILARALRTWWRHCRWSKATPASGESPPLPVSIERIRYDQTAPPATRPAGIAVGAITAAAAG